MSMMGQIAIQGQLESLIKLIEDLRADGIPDTEILDQLLSVMKEVVVECKTGWY